MAGSTAMPKGKPRSLESMPEYVQEASKAITKLWDAEEAEIEGQQVDFADLIDETVTVGKITLPIPTYLAYKIIRENVFGGADTLDDAVVNNATMWWVLDHQYEKDGNGKFVILKLRRKKGWRPSEDELIDYLGVLGFGSQDEDFMAAFQTAIAIKSTEEGRKNLQRARTSKQPVKIPVVRPFRSETSKAL
jgi:hypothetical protein